MTSAKDQAPGPAGMPENSGLSGGARRRPPPTIDLEATEVAARTAAAREAAVTSRTPDMFAGSGVEPNARDPVRPRSRFLDWQSWLAAIQRAAARWPQLDRPGPVIAATAGGVFVLVLTTLW